MNSAKMLYSASLNLSKRKNLVSVIRSYSSMFSERQAFITHIDNDDIFLTSSAVGPFAMNQYMIACRKTGEGAIIDSGLDTPNVFIDLAKKKDISIRHLIQTHAHIDHVSGVTETKKCLPDAPIYLHPLDGDLYNNASMQAQQFGLPNLEKLPKWDVNLHDCNLEKQENSLSKIKIGQLEFKVLHTPGHCPGHCCLYSEKFGLLFAGDLLFKGSIGRTDFPGCSVPDMTRSLKRMKSLPRDVRVFPGHMEDTTIGTEIDSNFHLFDL